VNLRKTKMPKKIRVTYSVKFETELTVQDGETVEDLIEDIEIPDNSDNQYVDNSFTVVSTEEV
jgi:hypothetical protein